MLCGANTDEHYKATRCPPDEWQRRWGVYDIDSVWSNDVLPCRWDLRNCVRCTAMLSLPQVYFTWSLLHVVVTRVAVVCKVYKSVIKQDQL